MSIASKSERKSKGKVPAAVLRGHRVIWGGKIPPGAMEQLKREYSKKRNPAKGARAVTAAQRALAKYKKRIAAERAAYAAAQKQQGTTGAVRLNPGPLRRLLKEAGAKKVRVMRDRSGRPTEVKFL